MPGQAHDDTPDAPEEAPAQKERGKPHGDLIVEQWQAPRMDKMKGDSREIWEYESDRSGASGTLWLYLVAVILVLIGGLAGILYALSRLVSSASSHGP
jgi:hypothetical protein